MLALVAGFTVTSSSFTGDVLHKTANLANFA